MKKANYPEKAEWDSLCKRPGQNDGTVDDAVAEILRDVKQNGDAAIRKLSEKFDGYCPENFLLASEALARAGDALSEKLKGAIDLAAANIQKFHESQIERVKKVETTAGVVCWRKSLPIERVGLYIPGGTAPLFSTLLMLGIPARIAGCKEIIVCTPPGAEGKIHPAIRYVANLIGIEKVYTIGGAQAIAAMAFGTESVPRVDKIFGPGNAFVTKAKQKVQEEGVAIDMPAGPS
ncbi:MAG: histidinol dehydrogenase, partial [Flavobacteriales bacterium]|nr:histidinol dehydrogenase [Flavobacteriales bacterium]